jgi:CheY-like chemotaxis protein
MNGAICLKSEEGHGSVFQIILRDVEIAEAPSGEESGNADENFAVFEPAKIMIVDDIRHNRELVKAYLNTANFLIFEADSGEAALNLLEKDIPDLIFMDLKMPGKSGYDVTAEIKANPDFKHIPVIALTASAMKEAEERIIALFDGYLRKPVNRKQIITELKRFLPYQTEKRHEQHTEQKETVSDGLNIRLPELKERLETEFIPQWKEISEMLVMDEIESFAQDLKQLAREYQIPFFDNYADALCDCARSYNVEGMEKLMPEFLNLADKIKK